LSHQSYGRFPAKPAWESPASQLMGRRLHDAASGQGVGGGRGGGGRGNWRQLLCPRAPGQLSPLCRRARRRRGGGAHRQHVYPTPRGCPSTAWHSSVQGKPGQCQTIQTGSECAVRRRSAPACRCSRRRWAWGPESGACTADSSPGLVLPVAGFSGTARRGGGIRPSVRRNWGSLPSPAKQRT